MALYLNRRDGVPGWEVGSSMLFIMFCELLYLTFWANVGYLMAADSLPSEFALMPWIGLAVLALFLLWVAFFRGPHPDGQRAARTRHPEGLPRGLAPALPHRRRHPLPGPARRSGGLYAGPAPCSAWKPRSWTCWVCCR